MKRKILILVISSIMISLAFMPSLNADVTSEKTQLKSTNNESLKSEAYSVKPTSDGGYIATGWIGEDDPWSYYYWGDACIYVIKTDSDGNLIWEKTLYGGIGVSVHETDNHGYLICGNTNEFDDPKYIILIKLDVDGNIQWEKRLDGELNKYYAGAMERTNDDGYIITGFVVERSGSYIDNMFLMKINSEGDVLWEQTYEYEDVDLHFVDYYTTSTAVQQTSDGGYIITGYNRTEDYGGEIILYKTDGNGNVEWTRVIRENIDAFRWDYAWDVKETTDRGFILVGYRWGSGDDNNTGLWLIKTDSQGKIVWDHTYRNAGGRSVFVTRNGKYVVAGPGESFAMGAAYLLKTDSQGIEEGQIDLGIGTINCMQQTYDQGFILAGSSGGERWGNKKLCLVKIGSGFYLEWKKVYGNIPPDQTIINGPSSGKTGEEYNFTFSSRDANKDRIFYWIDWGDGNVEEWIGPFDESKLFKISHQWANIGDYTIRVKSKDVYGEESELTTFEIKMSKTRSINNPFINQLKQLFEKWDFPLLSKFFNFYEVK